MILYPIEPHNHHLSIYLYSKNPPEVASYVIGNKFRRVLRTSGGLALFEVDFQNKGDTFLALLKCLLPQNTEPERETVNCIQNILGLNFDLTEFYELLELNPITKSLKLDFFGLKLLRSASFYESLIEAITEQQVSFRAAITIRKRLAARYSQRIIYEDREYLEFPSPLILASANLEELQSLGLSKNKANAIKAVAQLETEGVISKLCNSSVSDIFSELIKIKGIGNWTIQYAVCRGLGCYNIYPIEDHAFKMGVRKLFGDGELRTDKEVQQFMAEFGKYSGYLAFYIMYSFVYPKIG